MFSSDLNKKICVIKQPGGLGDIFYTQKIAQKLRDSNFEIHWYVLSQYYWIKDYISGIKWKDKLSEEMYTPLAEDQLFSDVMNTNFPIASNDFVYLPLMFAHALGEETKIMKSKYSLVNMKDDDWQDYFNFKRFQDKEDKLFYDKLGLKDNQEYCFVSENIGTGKDDVKKIAYNGNLPMVKLSFIDGFTLFDWCKVVENASEIHTMDSSISLLMEKLSLKADKLFLYTRRPGDFSEIDYLYKKNFKMVDL
jgi:hypothetical protein